MSDDTSRPAPTPSAPDKADAVDQLMPILLFLVLINLAGLVWAIGAMTLWAIKAQISRYRRGLPLARAMPIIVVYLLVRGTVGIIYDSEEVYFGIGIGAKGLAALALLISAAMRRNGVGYALPYLVPLDRDTKAHPEYRAATRQISIGVALVVFASVGFDIWLLQNASINKFVLIRLGVNWGLSILTLVMVGLYLDRRLRRIPGFTGMMPLIERSMKGLGMNPPPTARG